MFTHMTILFTMPHNWPINKNKLHSNIIGNMNILFQHGTVLNNSHSHSLCTTDV